jgi:hypothetical protein
MSSNIINQINYLPTSRNFPSTLDELVIEINRSYIDTANAVNNRTISIFPTTRPALTGESWFLTANQKQQSFRQVYTFSSTTSINHNISVQDPSQFVRCFGSYTDGTNTYGLIFGSNIAIAGQTEFYITSTQIVFVVGAGAPVLTNGVIILEWLSQP